MYLRKRTLCAAATLLLLLAAGCGLGDPGPIIPGGEKPVEGTSRPAVDVERLYTIPLSEDWSINENWVVDRDGNEIQVTQSDAQDYTEYDLTDLATGEVRYRYRIREEILRNEWGNPVIRMLRSLYDLEGNQLLGWEGKAYGNAFGEYIIRQGPRDGMAADELTGDYRSALYHVPTGTERYEGVFSVGKLGDNAFLLLDTWSTPLGVVDGLGEVVSGFPMPKTYYNAYSWNGYFIASSVHPQKRAKDQAQVEHLLDSNFRELYTFDWISEYYGNMKGSYLQYQSGEERGIFHPTDGVLFSVEGMTIEYFDPGLAIVQTGYYRSEEDPIKAALVAMDKSEIAGGFSWLVPVQNYEDSEPAKKFLGLSGGKAVLIDRAGKKIASSVALPNVRSLNILCDGLYTYYIEEGEFYGEGLLGPNLEVLVPAGGYIWISLAPGFWSGNTQWDGSAASALLQASKGIGHSDVPGGMIYRMDILDSAGKVVVNNVTALYDVGPDRIALRRGFQVGLMDWDGNWIVKRSIFNSREND